MGRRKKNSAKEELLNLLFGACFVLATYIWVQTNSIAAGVVTFIGTLFIVFICLQAYRRHKDKMLVSSGIYDVDKMNGT